MHSVLNTFSEYTYFNISKNITSYTFLHVFKIVENLQCILNIETQLFLCLRANTISIRFLLNVIAFFKFLVIHLAWLIRWYFVFIGALSKVSINCHKTVILLVLSLQNLLFLFLSTYLSINTYNTYGLILLFGIWNFVTVKMNL